MPLSKLLRAYRWVMEGQEDVAEETSVGPPPTSFGAKPAGGPSGQAAAGGHEGASPATSTGGAPAGVPGGGGGAAGAPGEPQGWAGAGAQRGRSEWGSLLCAQS